MGPDYTTHHKAVTCHKHQTNHHLSAWLECSNPFTMTTTVTRNLPDTRKEHKSRQHIHPNPPTIRICTLLFARHLAPQPVNFITIIQDRFRIALNIHSRSQTGLGPDTRPFPRICLRAPPRTETWESGRRDEKAEQNAQCQCGSHIPTHTLVHSTVHIQVKTSTDPNSLSVHSAYATAR